MKAAATCREEILRAAILLKQSSGEISMRQIAQACGVAVGTVYHYFPDKTSLLIAAVEQVWREIFAPLMKPGLPGDALSLVEAMGGCIREGRRRYPGFFSAHGLAFDDAERGRAAMDEATGHMRAMLAEAFSPHAAELTEPLTPQALADFTLDCFKMDLMTGCDRTALIKALLMGVLADGKEA